MLQDEGVMRDNKGYKGALRLWVPPALVASSYHHNKSQTSEQKTVFTQKRIQGDDAVAARSELGSAFSRFTGAASEHGLTAAAPAGGWHDRSAAAASFTDAEQKGLAVLQKARWISCFRRNNSVDMEINGAAPLPLETAVAAGQPSSSALPAASEQAALGVSPTGDEKKKRVDVALVHALVLQDRLLSVKMP
eukprot:6487282-Amphidinium_carterae.2